MVIVRIEYIDDKFCKILLLHCLVIVTPVKLIQLKVRDRLGIPYTQRIYHVIAVSDDRHVIGDSQNRLIIFLDKFILSCDRIFLKADIASETYFLCILFSAQLKRISLS